MAPNQPLCHPRLWELFTHYQQIGQSFILSFEDGRWLVQELTAGAAAAFPVALPAPAGWRLNFTSASTLAVVGPDGSGKTTLIDAARTSAVGRGYSFKRFKRYFRRVLLHLRRQQDRNDLEENMPALILPLAWLTFSVSRLLFGWFKPIVLDRYFYDYLVRNVRHPQLALRTIACYPFVSRLLPKPGALVIAACPATIVHQRKAEMAPANVQALYQVYCDQVLKSGIRKTLFCHTGIDPQVSRQQFIDFLA